MPKARKTHERLQPNNRKAPEVKEHRPCNLCGQSFLMYTRFDRFCSPCKQHSERYKSWGYGYGETN